MSLMSGVDWVAESKLYRAWSTKQFLQITRVLSPANLFENALIRTREVVFALGSPCELLINFRVKINTSCMSNFRRDSYHLRDNHEANFYIWLWRILSVVYHSHAFHETKKNKNTTKKREWGWRASCFKILGPLDRPLEGDQPNTSRRWNHKAKMEIDRARPS